MLELLVDVACAAALGAIIWVRTRPAPPPEPTPPHAVGVPRTPPAARVAPGRQATFKRRRERWTDATKRPPKR